MLRNIFLSCFLHSYLPKEFYNSSHVLYNKNGIAKRRNRRLIEIERTLMFNTYVLFINGEMHSSVPIS